MKLTLYAIGLLAVVGTIILYCSRVTTPEEAWNKIVRSYMSSDATPANLYTTDTGKKVASWLFGQMWVKQKLKPRILARTRIGDRYEIEEQFVENDGTETVKLIFVLREGIWKFEDIYLETMKGDTFDMYLSEFLNNPIAAKVKFGWKNPRKVFSAPFASVANIGRDAVGWMKDLLYNAFKLVITAGLTLIAAAFAGLFFYEWFMMKIRRRKNI